MLAGRCGQHAARHFLCKKERPAQIDVHQFVIALRRHVEYVATLLHRDAGIVNEAFEAAKGREDVVGHGRKPSKFRDVTNDEGRARAALAQAGQGLSRRLVLDDIVNDNVVTGLGKAIGDAAADAAPAAGDENPRALRHANASRAISMRWIWLVPS